MICNLLRAPQISSCFPYSSLSISTDFQPQARNTSSAISSPLYTQTATIDFATRLAKVLAVRTKKGVYVSSSASFHECVSGGTVDEEMDGFRRIVAVVLARVGAQ